jgi:hypothetical protein
MADPAFTRPRRHLHASARGSPLFFRSNRHLLCVLYVFARSAALVTLRSAFLAPHSSQLAFITPRRAITTTPPFCPTCARPSAFLVRPAHSSTAVRPSVRPSVRPFKPPVQPEKTPPFGFTKTLSQIGEPQASSHISFLSD